MKSPISFGFALLLSWALACSSGSDRSSGTQGSSAGSSQSAGSGSTTGSGGGSGGVTASASGGNSKVASSAGTSSSGMGGSAGGSATSAGGATGGSSQQNSEETSSGGTGGQSASSSTTSQGGTGGQASTGGAQPSGGSSSSISGGQSATGGIQAGVGGSVGSSGSGGANTGAPDAGRDVGTGTASFICNLVFGNTTTQQWFNGGFLTYSGIDASRWELIAVGHHYIGSWAQANDSGWTTGFDSSHQCDSNAQNPDRVIFIVTQSPPYSTAKQYQTDITAIVKNIKARYTQVKRVELTTLIRSPNNNATACSSKSGNEQSIPTAEDEGLAAVAADPAFAGIVVVLPPFYVTACSDFNQDAPQYTDKGAANIAKVYGAYFAVNP